MSTLRSMPKTWKYKLSSAFLASLLSSFACSADSAPKEKAVMIGRIKWAIYDTATSRILSNGVREKNLRLSDVKIIRKDRTMYDKEIDLGDHFSFGLVYTVDGGKPAREAKLPDGRAIDGNGYVLTRDGMGGSGERKIDHGSFGLTGERDDVKTFSWDWFEVRQPGHATKLQESGELSFDTKKTPNGTEINHMVFLTDVSIRVCRESDDHPLNPTWRIKIFKGSAITWPVLVDGEVKR
jgi:hypothetical protein